MRIVTDWETKDSGNRTQYSSGLQRDISADKPRFDLIVPKLLPYKEQMLTRWADLMARGAQKYSERNWERASQNIDLQRFYESATRHFFQWLTREQDEDHAAAVFFNIQGAEYVKWRLADDDEA